MSAANERFGVLNTAFWTALLPSASSDVAETCVLEGIAAAEPGQPFGTTLLTQTVRSAMKRRENRVLLGTPRENCTEILPLGPDEFGDALRLSLENLAPTGPGSIE